MINPHFIGREREIQEMTRYYQSGRSEFIAVYGRRRVGKTFLVRSLYDSQYSFYASGVLNGSKKEELDTFSRALREYGYAGATPKNWFDAFDCLAGILASSKEKERCILFLDEISSFDTPSSGFLKALEYFWNVKASAQSNVMLISSGSATQWIMNKVLNDRGGLHNRVTRQIHLRPFTLKEVEEYGKANGSSWQRIHYLQMYAAIGGIPYYWDKLNLQESVEYNMDEMFFSKNAAMSGEFQNLYRSIFRKPEPYLAVIKELATNKTGLTRKEISERLKVESGSFLTQLLADLENCDFIRSYSNKTKSNNRIYQLVDFYTLFHFQFEKKLNGDKDYWKKNSLSPMANTWYGLSFERICLSHYEQILYALHLDSINTEVYSWRSRTNESGAQIDLVIERSDSMTTLCEAKYSRAFWSIDKNEYQRLLSRMESFREERDPKGLRGIQMVLLTTFGINDSKYGSVFNKVLDVDSLFVI